MNFENHLKKTDGINVFLFNFDLHLPFGFDFFEKQSYRILFRKESGVNCFTHICCVFFQKYKILICVFEIKICIIRLKQYIILSI
jgi:hypothetical protein